MSAHHLFAITHAACIRHEASEGYEEKSVHTIFYLDHSEESETNNSLAQQSQRTQRARKHGAEIHTEASAGRRQSIPNLFH